MRKIFRDGWTRLLSRTMQKSHARCLGQGAEKTPRCKERGRKEAREGLEPLSSFLPSGSTGCKGSKGTLKGPGAGVPRRETLPGMLCQSKSACGVRLQHSQPGKGEGAPSGRTQGATVRGDALCRAPAALGHWREYAASHKLVRDELANGS